jgi:tetratricopeptide (TPR) repeat protein
LRDAASLIDSVTLRRAGAGALFSVIVIPNLVADFELLRTNLRYRARPTEAYVSSNGAVHFGQPWGQMGAWIRTNIPDSVVLASPAKELVPFIENRKLLETSRTLPTPIVERFLRDHDARYLLTTTLWDDLETFDITMAESRRFWFKRVHSVGHLKLYEIHSALTESPPKSDAVTDDTSGIHGLLLRGRRHLQGLRYAEAIDALNKAVQAAPFRPEPLFELMSAVSVVGDSTAAMALFERLFTLPQSTAYTQLARAMIVTMEKLLRAQQQSSLERSHTAFEGGLAYWQLGYTGPALAVMRNIAQSDSLHFVSALWGAYFARQLGDTVESNQFLKRLNKIDRHAAIVADWNALRALEERIKRTRDAVGKASLHMKISKIYSKIELYEEALDALERAGLAAPEKLIDILLARAEIYEKKQVALAAVRSYRSVLDLEPHNVFARERLELLTR